MQCPHCGNDVAEGAAFYTTCGARQQAPAAPVNPYSNPNPYGQANPYGQPNSNPYANANPYGNPYGAGYRGPRPSVSFGDAIRLFFENYANFNGRARRSEYWYAYLFNMLLSLVSWIPVIGWIAAVAVLVPSLAVAVRRMHDLGKSGWSLLVGLIPFVGGIIVLIWMCSDSEPRPNQYGPSPKYS